MARHPSGMEKIDLTTFYNMNNEVRVLIADKMDPRAAGIFRDRGIHVDEKPGLSPEEFAKVIGDYDGLAVRSSTRVTAAIMSEPSSIASGRTRFSSASPW